MSHDPWRSPSPGHRSVVVVVVVVALHSSSRRAETRGRRDGATDGSSRRRDLQQLDHHAAAAAVDIAQLDAQLLPEPELERALALPLGVHDHVGEQPARREAHLARAAAARPGLIARVACSSIVSVWAASGASVAWSRNASAA